MYVAPSLEQRERLLDYIVRDFAADSDVVGVYLAGSHAAGTADAHADIDLRVVVDEHAASRFRHERLARPARWPGFLFNEWSDDERFCVSHFDGFVKVDIVYVASDALAPSPWLTRPIRVLHDPKGTIAATIAQSQARRVAPTADDVEQALGRMLAYAHEAVRRASGGELLYAQTMLDRLRGQMATLEDFAERRTPGFGSPTKLEARLTPALVAALHESCTTNERLEHAVRSLLPHARSLVERLHRDFDLAVAIDRHLRAIDALADAPGAGGARRTDQAAAASRASPRSGRSRSRPRRAARPRR